METSISESMNCCAGNGIRILYPLISGSSSSANTDTSTCRSVSWHGNSLITTSPFIFRILNSTTSFERLSSGPATCSSASLFRFWTCTSRRRFSCSRLITLSFLSAAICLRIVSRSSCFLWSSALYICWLFSTGESSSARGFTLRDDLDELPGACTSSFAASRRFSAASAAASARASISSDLKPRVSDSGIRSTSLSLLRSATAGATMASSATTNSSFSRRAAAEATAFRISSRACLAAGSRFIDGEVRLMGCVLALWDSA
mmetsp:Transcript_5167/g.7176  ORF Transcript_5167/g.7176 Transcript_5167/m.7176 type:complete len:261 (-) Transcript_5167:465-1247(-)